MAKLKIAFLGTGGIAAKHANVYKDHPDTQIVGGCDVTADIVNGFWDRVYGPGQGNPRPAVFTDAKSMYEKTKPDAVVICTPHTLHYDQAVQALGYGCHILMEKPMVTRAEHAYLLRDAVKKAGKIFVVGYNTPCSPEFAFIRDVIRKQELGKLELVSGFLVQGWLKATIGKWRQDPALSGGGQAYDSGAHMMCSICWTVESQVAEVFAFVDNHGTRVDINSVINVRFANGAFASITIGGNCPASGAHLMYAFDNGRIDCDGWGATWMKMWKGNREVKYPPVTGEPQSPADNFISAILGRAEARTNPENGIIHSELMDAIYESQRTGKPVKPKR